MPAELRTARNHSSWQEAALHCCRYSLAVAGLIAATAAWPMSAGAIGTETAPSPQPQTPAVAPAPSAPGSFDAAASIERARDLIDRELYAQALATLEAVVSRNPGNADALNYLGFASRKLGRYQDARHYYDRALEIDPHHLGALEYLGELHVEMGDMDAARGNLAMLSALCPEGCEPLDELREVIAAHED